MHRGVSSGIGQGMGVVDEARQCRMCEGRLEPRPVLRVEPHHRVVVIGQAPGVRVHASGEPWADASGAHLRTWLGVDDETFATAFAILPMGLCYPGSMGDADRPPEPICAPTWHPRLLALVLEPELTLLVGQHAIHRYLPHAPPTVTETVRTWRTWAPRVFVLPHPSWRSRGWMKRNPWFEAEVLPALRVAVRSTLARPALRPQPPLA